MLLLLPPSESKRAGGVAAPLQVGALRFPELTPQRTAALEAIAAACAAGEDAAVRAFQLGPRTRGAIETNRRIRTSPSLPAVERYTGVLYDALDPASLAPDARGWLGEHALIHSAPFGPVGALDPLPDYRVSAGARLPGIRMRRLWADAVSAVLSRHDGLILDARSEAYAALGPRPERENAVYLRVVTRDSAGRTRALNHFNKHAKGTLARALALSQAAPATVRELCGWAAAHGFALAPGGPREIQLAI